MLKKTAIPPTIINTPREQQALEIIIEAFESIGGMTTRLRMIDLPTWHKQYIGESSIKHYQGAANLKCSATFEACETLISVIESIETEPEYPFGIIGTEEEDVKIANKILRPLMSWQLRQINFRKKFKSFLRHLVKNGTSFVKYSPHPAINSLDFIPKGIANTYIDPRLNPDNEPIDYADVIIDDMEVPWQKLKAKEGSTYLKKIDLLLLDAYQYDKQKNARQSVIYERVGISGTRKKTVKDVDIIEADATLKLEGDEKPEEYIVTIANRKVVIRLKKHKKKRWLVDQFIPQDDTIYGLGVPQIVESDHNELRDTKNQVMDDITHVLNRMYVANRTMIDRQSSVNQFKSRPMGLIWAKGDPRIAIMPLVPPIFLADGLKKIEMLKESVRQWSGAQVSLMALAMKTTATEDIRMRNAAFRRVMSIMHDIETKVLNKFLCELHEYNKKYILNSKEKLTRILGKKAFEYIEQNPDAVQGNYDFSFVGVLEIENKITRAQQMINFYNLTSQNPRSSVHPGKLEKKIWAKGFGYRDWEDISIPDPEQKLLHPEDENILLEQNQRVAPSIFDNHENHKLSHVQSGINTEAMAEHLQLHDFLQQQMLQKQSRGLSPSQEQPNRPREREPGEVQGEAGTIPTQY